MTPQQLKTVLWAWAFFFLISMAGESPLPILARFFMAGGMVLFLFVIVSILPEKY